MYLSPEKKQEIFETKGKAKSKIDTGSSESQIALFTYRINYLTEHLKKNKKDHRTFKISWMEKSNIAILLC